MASLAEVRPHPPALTTFAARLLEVHDDVVADRGRVHVNAVFRDPSTNFVSGD